MNKKRDMEFLFEIGFLRFLQRNWERFFAVKMANNSEHTFRVVWLALILARKEGVKDEEKVMKMALVHDIVESRSGDVDYLSRQYVERKEELAIRDMLQDTSFEDDFIGIWEEYEAKESMESRVVKDADWLDIDLELMEQKDSSPSVVEVKRKMRKEVVVPKFYTETAKKMWEEVYQSNVHDWHLNGRNRASSGDWKEEE